MFLGRLGVQASPDFWVVPHGLPRAEVERENIARSGRDGLDAICPQEGRLWFLRGLSDSDGDVHFRDKSVDITTAPNTGFVKALLDSMNVRIVVRFTKGYGVITIRAPGYGDCYFQSESEYLPKEAAGKNSWCKCLPQTLVPLA
jgi:hypothetical protein